MCLIEPRVIHGWQPCFTSVTFCEDVFLHFLTILSIVLYLGIYFQVRLLWHRVLSDKYSQKQQNLYNFCRWAIGIDAYISPNWYYQMSNCLIYIKAFFYIGASLNLTFNILYVAHSLVPVYILEWVSNYYIPNFALI